MLDSSVLMLKRTPSYRISDLDVKLIKLPMYESAEPLEEDLGASVAAAAIRLYRAFPLSPFLFPLLRSLTTRKVHARKKEKRFLDYYCYFVSFSLQ